MDDDEMTHFTMLDRPNCWSKCRKAGRCNYCGSHGYCCHADGRGACTWDMVQVLKGSFFCRISSLSHTIWLIYIIIINSYLWTMHNNYDQIKLIKTRGERGMKCIVPDTLRNDLRLETKLSSACRDIHKVLMINFRCTSVALPVNLLCILFSSICKKINLRPSVGH